MARDWTEREKELLMSARAQLSAIVDPVGPGAWRDEAYLHILELMGEIEKMLGYS